MHCLMHRQHLVAKHLSGRRHDFFNIVIRGVNHIKSNFQEFCRLNGEDHERLVKHTKVRWLSKSHCLRRLIELWGLVTSG